MSLRKQPGANAFRVPDREPEPAPIRGWIRSIAASWRGPRVTPAELARHLDRLSQSDGQLRRQIADLQQTLEKRSQRLHQLIGERDQLKALMGERELQVQRLNQEVGALASQQPKNGAMRQALREMLASLRRARLPATARTSEASAIRADNGARVGAGAPLRPWIKEGEAHPILAAVLVGLREPEFERVLDLVERSCEARGLVPLLLTDHDAFHLLRGRRVLYEYLQPEADRLRHAPELDWHLFLLRRLALIRRKWRPLCVVAFGRDATEVVHRWVQSPFEPTALPTIVGGQAWFDAPKPCTLAAEAEARA